MDFSKKIVGIENLSSLNLIPYQPLFFKGPQQDTKIFCISCRLSILVI